MKKEEKIIIVGSPEAAEYRTNIEGWVSADGRFFGKDEQLAKYFGATHKKCECGELFKKEWAYTVCRKCLDKKNYEQFLKLPLVEWDREQYVCTHDGDEYFWNEDMVIDYMVDNDLDEIDLRICSPIFYSKISIENVADDAHEDYKPPKQLEEKINELNKYLQTLPPHSWEPGKVRTTYKLDESYKEAE